MEGNLRGQARRAGEREESEGGERRGRGAHSGRVGKRERGGKVRRRIVCMYICAPVNLSRRAAPSLTSSFPSVSFT